LRIYFPTALGGRLACPLSLTRRDGYVLAVAEVAASVIAVCGTIAGISIGYLFQRRGSQLDYEAGLSERRRAERLEACGSFAAAVVESRRAQYDRWYRRQEDPEKMTPIEARNQSYCTRTATWGAFYRLRLITADTELTRLAWLAVDEAAHIHLAETETELHERGERVRDLLEQFVATAADIFCDGPLSHDRAADALTAGRPGVKPADLQSAS